jgi:thioredoxin
MNTRRLVLLALLVLQLCSVAAAGAAQGVINASDSSFGDRVLSSRVPVLVDFWAPWCMPCKKLEAPLAAVAAEMGNRARIVRVNIRWNPEYARRYGVVALPTTLVFVNGQVVDRISGVLSAEEIKDSLESAMAPARTAAADGQAAALPAPSAPLP